MTWQSTFIHYFWTSCDFWSWLMGMLLQCTGLLEAVQLPILGHHLLDQRINQTPKHHNINNITTCPGTDHRDKAKPHKGQSCMRECRPMWVASIRPHTGEHIWLPAECDTRAKEVAHKRHQCTWELGGTRVRLSTSLDQLRVPTGKSVRIPVGTWTRGSRSSVGKNLHGSGSRFCSGRYPPRVPVTDPSLTR